MIRPGLELQTSPLVTNSMSQHLWQTLAVAVTFLVAACALADDLGKPQRPPDATRLYVGMTQAEVKKLHGEPSRVARQILFRRHLEQWVYDGAQPLRIEFNCLRGQEPRVVNFDQAGN
jgi:hypothetical protein